MANAVLISSSLSLSIVPTLQIVFRNRANLKTVTKMTSVNYSCCLGQLYHPRVQLCIGLSNGRGTIILRGSWVVRLSLTIIVGLVFSISAPIVGSRLSTIFHLVS